MGVGGDREGRVVPSYVAVVPLFDVGSDLFEGGVETPIFELQGAAARALFEAGGHVELKIGVGRDDGRGIAAFENDATLLYEGSLEGDESAAHGRVLAERAGGLTHLGGSDLLGYVLAIEENALGFAGAERDVGVVHKPGGFGSIDVLAAGFEGEGAVHGAGVQILEAKFFGEAFGDGALTGSGGTVDGDYKLGH